LSLAVAALLAAVPSLAVADAAAEALEIRGKTYRSWTEYFTSTEFRENGGRCATPADAFRTGSSAPSDCSNSQTNPVGQYDPNGGDILEIPIVVHIITNAAGTLGDTTDQQVQSQIDVLNEDFQALAGTAGEGGTNANIRFRLATTDPEGSPTTGVTRTANETWFNDTGNYWDTLSWDPKNYCNVYTNKAFGGAALGYVPFLPASGLASTAQDRIVILYSAFGRPAPGGPPYNLGRTLTHEMGHFLGMIHTFDGNGVCETETTPGCYSSGDLVCDTASEEDNRFGCPEDAAAVSCGSLDPIHNYMDYTDDLCMNQFTPEQANRMRCSLMEYRGALFDSFTPVRSSSWGSIKHAFR
jgi:hypothetical protein